MKLKMRIMTTLLGLVFGCGIAASQTPRAEQTMNTVSYTHLTLPTIA